MSRYTEKQEAEVLRLARVRASGPMLEEIKRRHVNLDGEASDHPRSYHTWDHVLDVLVAIWEANLAGLMDSVEDYDSFVLAGLCHDIYYEPGAPSADNERQSVKLMYKLVDEYGKPGYPKLDLAEHLILSTSGHGRIERPVVRNVAVFMDTDLAGLACPYPRFIEQNLEVDAEFLTVGDKVKVLMGRQKFLESMLAKQTIYLSDYFGSRLEWRARNNLQRLLSEMTAGRLG